MPIDINKKNTVLGRLALFLATVIWGSSFVILKNTLDFVSVPYTMALRFSGAAAVMALMSLREIKNLDKSYLAGGAAMGAALFMAYLLQTYGLVYTTPGKNAFLTSTCCVIAPFLYWAVYKIKPDRYNVIAAFVCVAGMGMVSLKGDFSVGFGDALTAGCGFFFALHLVFTAHFTHGRKAALLNTVQLASVALLSWAAALCTGPVPGRMPVGAVASLIYLCVMCTAAAFFLQTFGQKYTPPAIAAVIMTLEAMFGVLTSVLFYGESLSARLIVGFALIFAAILVSETKLSFFHRKSEIGSPVDF